jgi:hypothetical protein
MVIQAKGLSLSLSPSLSVSLSFSPGNSVRFPRLPNSTFSLEAHHHHPAHLPPWLPVCFPVMVSQVKYGQRRHLVRIPDKGKLVINPKKKVAGNGDSSNNNNNINGVACVLLP